MSPPSEIRIVELLRPYLDEHLLTDGMLTSLRTYLDLILKWNAHTNLTAIRDPEELVQRQIGESLFAGGLVPLSGTLLDFGSGAGFPGVPLQILRPGLKVTLAESQGKKASFLREAVRTLACRAKYGPGASSKCPPGAVSTRSSCARSMPRRRCCRSLQIGSACMVR